MFDSLNIIDSQWKTLYEQINKPKLVYINLISIKYKHIITYHMKFIILIASFK